MPKLKKKEGPAVRTLVEITHDLGESDATQKLAKKLRDQGRDEFFAAATEILAAENLARKTINSVSAESLEEAKHYAVERNSGWRAVTGIQREEGVYSVILEEDPQFLPFVYVNKEDERVFSRSISAGNLMLDEEALEADNLDLFEEVTHVVGADVLWDFLDQFDGNPELKDAASAFIAVNPERFPRVLRPLDDLTQEQIDGLQSYVYEGPKTPKLNAPRKAKEEELS